ncbi:MAG: PAS domain S-box protein [Candidatus Aminicenantes bacterium]|nr:PAS domain S-box protein [Candidatus Aminicenantes bacterium]NIM78235.1 PAS domain S-box protein [Candidatus Aminicenantes bacterium]NIN23741.1 PAS domain S-box protein [Candidatus Aminicenantes bacterium]NIN47448.1 PAS domain S-box protein [Candidatus Aminicenantes bacterium]NIN90376.1 PAS domain S-box protein [Candidatus Aminicenantes bacterium]
MMIETLGKQEFISGKYAAIIIGALVLIGLYLASLYNYLLFHALAEIFSVVVAYGIFVFAWNSRRLIDNVYLLFIGCAYLFIGVMDLVHTLAYTGMNIFHGYNTNLPAQLWIATRYMESLSLLIAPLLTGKKLNITWLLSGYTVVVVLLLGMIFGGVFPVCFLEGVGLTSFKKFSEYLISLILVGAFVLLGRKRHEFDPGVVRLLMASIIFTIASELAFTFYIHAYGFSNLIGHYFKIVSFYLIYKAIIETGLKKPFRLLFRDIKQREEALRESEEIFRTLAENSQDYIMRYDKECRHVYENPASLRAAGFTEEDIIGKTHREAGFDEELCQLFEERITRVFKTGESSQTVFEWESANGMVYLDWRLYPEFDRKGNVKTVVGISRDITELKQVEEQLKAALRGKEVLLKEVCHRTKNNMASICSILKLKSALIEDEQSLNILQDIENRISSMALVQEKLYRSEDITNIDLREYVKDLAHEVLKNYQTIPPKVSLKFDVEPVTVSTNTAIPCALILSELLSNAMKYAFPGDKRGEITIALHTTGEGEIELGVSDNGVGMSNGFDFRKADSLGLKLVIMLAEGQLHGHVDFKGGKGTGFIIRFKERKEKR